MLMPGPHPRPIKAESGKYPEGSILICNSNPELRSRIPNFPRGEGTAQLPRRRAAVPLGRNTGLSDSCLRSIHPRSLPCCTRTNRIPGRPASSAWKGSPGPNSTYKDPTVSLLSSLRQASEPLSHTPQGHTVSRLSEL